MTGNDNRYDRRTLIGAGLAFAAFALFLYFVPDIMLTVGSVSPILAAVVVGVVLLLPFAGLWLHARLKRRDQ